MIDLRDIEGLYVGQLDSAELAAFNAAIKEHRAYRSYEHPGGLLGLAKVRMTRHHNGAPMFAGDGTMLDERGNRSIFDDIDQ